MLRITYEGKEVFSSAKPSVLVPRIITSATFKGYYGDALDYIRAKKQADTERIAAEQKEAYLASLARQQAAAAQEAAGLIELDGDGKADSDVEITGQTRSASASASAPPMPAPVQTQTQTQPGGLRLTLSASKTEKYYCVLRPHKKVAALVKFYMQQVGLDKSKASQVKILFDGEELAHDQTIEDAGIEDEELLEVRAPPA